MGRCLQAAKVAAACREQPVSDDGPVEDRANVDDTPLAPTLTRRSSGMPEGRAPLNVARSLTLAASCYGVSPMHGGCRRHVCRPFSELV